MNIGIYISPAHAVPPDEKNILAPWVLVAQLADGLVEKGHDVVLFAAKGSLPRTVSVRGRTNVKLVSGGILPAAQRQTDFSDHAMYQSFVASQNLALLREAVSYVKSHKLDVLHIHTAPEGLYPVLLALPQKLPVVVTFHDPIKPERFPGLEKVMELGNVHLVSLSTSQQKGVPFPFAGVVPNGVDTTLFVPDKGLPKQNLLMTGRIVPEKGFTDAIAAVRRAGGGERLMIVGQKYEQLPGAKRYFEEEIEPTIDGKTVIWEPVVKQDHLVGHYQTAKALLFPIHWEEPFGLVMIEAMACGTPVIAYNHGSVSEVVVDGVTGFIVEPDAEVGTGSISQHGVLGLVEAIKRIGEIDRNACRKHVEKNFSLATMISGYESIYQSLALLEPTPDLPASEAGASASAPCAVPAQ